MPSMAWLSTGSGETVQQTQLAPDGLVFPEDVSPGRWVEDHVWCVVTDIDLLTPTLAGARSTSRPS